MILYLLLINEIIMGILTETCNSYVTCKHSRELIRQLEPILSRLLL